MPKLFTIAHFANSYHWYSDVYLKYVYDNLRVNFATFNETFDLNNRAGFNDKKVKVGNYQEMAQSERNSYSKYRVGFKLYIYNQALIL